MITINNDTSDILARFLTLPPDNYAALKSKVEELDDDILELENELDDKGGRIRELEAALADSLSWIQETLGGECKAHDNKEFSRLWGIL